MNVAIHLGTIFLALAIPALILQYSNSFDYNKLKGLKSMMLKIVLISSLIFVLQGLSLIFYLREVSKPYQAPPVQVNYVQPNPVLQLGDDFISEGEYEDAIIKWFNEKYPSPGRY